MNCQQVNLLKEAYVDGQLPHAQADEVAMHSASCPVCRPRLAQAQRLRTELGGAMKAVLGQPALAPAARARLRDSLAAGLPAQRMGWSPQAGLGLVALLLAGVFVLLNADSVATAWRRLLEKPSLQVPAVDQLSPTPATPTSRVADLVPTLLAATPSQEPADLPPTGTVTPAASPSPAGQPADIVWSLPVPDHPDLSKPLLPPGPPFTVTRTPRQKPAATRTPFPMATATGTPTEPPGSNTPTPTPFYPYGTPSRTPTWGPSPTDTPTATPFYPYGTPSRTPTWGPSPTDTPTATPFYPYGTPTPSPGPWGTPTRTATITPTPSPGPWGTPTATETPTPSPGPWGTPTSSPTPGPAATDTPTPTPFSMGTATATPTPTRRPTRTRTPRP